MFKWLRKQANLSYLCIPGTHRQRDRTQSWLGPHRGAAAWPGAPPGNTQTCSNHCAPPRGHHWGLAVKVIVKLSIQKRHLSRPHLLVNPGHLGIVRPLGKEVNELLGLVSRPHQTAARLSTRPPGRSIAQHCLHGRPPLCLPANCPTHCNKKSRRR